MKKQYNFSTKLVAETSNSSGRKVERDDEESDEESRGLNDTFVDNFFAKKNRSAVKADAYKSRDSMDDSWMMENRFKSSLKSKSNDHEEMEESKSYSTNMSTTNTNGFLRHHRPKPDLGDASDENDDEVKSRSLVKGEVVHLPAKAPAKPLPPQQYKRQRELARFYGMDDEEAKRQMLEKRRQEKREAEERKRKEKYWMAEFLQGAKRAFDDSGPSGKVVLRKDTLQDSADTHTTGKNIYHNQFVAHPNMFYAGRFYIEPLGSKPNELNTRGMTLFLYIGKTGPEGLTLRVGKKFYDLFEGDIGVVPSDSLYSFVNPSTKSTCELTYTLVANPVNSSQEHEEGEDEDDAASEDLNDDAVLEYKLPWKHNKDESKSQ